MQCNMRLGVGPCAHHFLHFVLSHLVLSESNIVAEESTAELVSDGQGNDGPPGDAKHHIKGDAKSLHSAKLVATRQVVDSACTDSETIERHSEGDVTGVLLFLLGQEELVGFVLKLSTLSHCTSSLHFSSRLIC